MNLLFKMRGLFSQAFTPKTKVPSEICELSNRSLLILNGPDCHKLLQGITTNDIRQLGEIKVEKGKLNRVAIFTLFLNQKGKVITDAFIIRPRINSNGTISSSNEELWIDVPRQAKNVLKLHLSKYMWKKEVQLHDVEGDRQEDEEIPKIYSLRNDAGIVPKVLFGCQQTSEQHFGSQSAAEEGTYANLVYYDPRGSSFGLRLICMQPEFQVKGFFQPAPLQKYELTMKALGVTPLSIVRDKLPFQYSYDLMNAISFGKGCFLGQQIISRAYFTGIIRRRVFPFYIEANQDYTLQPNAVLQTQDKKEIGKVIEYRQGMGLVLANYLPWMETPEQWPLIFSKPIKGFVMSPFHQELIKYFQEMKEKQNKISDLDL